MCVCACVCFEGVYLMRLKKAAAPALYVNNRVWSTHSRREVAFTPRASLKLLTFQRQQWPRCSAAQQSLSGSISLAPGLCGLQIISSAYKLIELPHVLLFLCLQSFQDAFWLSVLHIETGSPVGVVKRLQGGSKGVREKLSVYFLSLALGNLHHKFFAYF